MAVIITQAAIVFADTTVRFGNITNKVLSQSKFRVLGLDPDDYLWELAYSGVWKRRTGDWGWNTSLGYYTAVGVVQRKFPEASVVRVLGTDYLCSGRSRYSPAYKAVSYIRGIDFVRQVTSILTASGMTIVKANM